MAVVIEPSATSLATTAPATILADVTASSFIEASIIFVKSPSHFRVGYSSHSEKIIIADTPGSTCCDIKKIKYQNIKRQVHPLDEI